MHAQLRILSSAGSGLAEVRAAMLELRQRMGTRLKEAQLPLLHAMSTLPSMTLLWRDGADSLLDEVATHFATDAESVDLPAHPLYKWLKGNSSANDKEIEALVTGVSDTEEDVLMKYLYA